MFDLLALIGWKWRQEVLKDRRAVEELRRHYERLGKPLSSRLAPTYEETLPLSGRWPPEGRKDRSPS